MFKISKSGKKRKEEVYCRFGRKLYGYAITSWKVSEDDAWELVYKTIDKVVESERKYSFANDEKFGGFVFTVFVNYLRNHYRDNIRNRTVTMPLNDDITVTVPAAVDTDEMNDSQQMKILKEELDKLEDWQRILLLMRAQDFSYEEIEKVIGKPPAEQLKVYFLRYKQKLKDSINLRINSAK